MHDVHQLVEWMKANGTVVDGKFTTTFGVLYDRTQDIFEALMGTLKAAKKRGYIDFAGQLLLKGNAAHEKTVITLLKTE